MHCVDLGESFPTSIYLQKSASIQPRTSPSKFGGKLFNIIHSCPQTSASTALFVDWPWRTSSRCMPPAGATELSRLYISHPLSGTKQRRSLGTSEIPNKIVYTSYTQYPINFLCIPRGRPDKIHHAAEITTFHLEPLNCRSGAQTSII